MGIISLFVTHKLLGIDKGSIKGIRLNFCENVTTNKILLESHQLDFRGKQLQHNNN